MSPPYRNILERRAGDQPEQCGSGFPIYSRRYDHPTPAADCISPSERRIQDDQPPRRANGLVVLELGLAYWYLLYPIHRLIFAGMISSLTQRPMEITMKGKYE